MESVNVTSAILDKKLEEYAWRSEDYVAERELTITITLAEYRQLIAEVATKNYDIKKANEDKYKRDAENAQLRAKVERLNKRLYSEPTQNTEDKSC